MRRVLPPLLSARRPRSLGSLLLVSLLVLAALATRGVAAAVNSWCDEDPFELVFRAAQVVAVDTAAAVTIESPGRYTWHHRDTPDFPGAVRPISGLGEGGFGMLLLEPRGEEEDASHSDQMGTVLMCAHLGAVGFNCRVKHWDGEKQGDAATFVRRFAASSGLTQGATPAARRLSTNDDTHVYTFLAESSAAVAESLAGHAEDVRRIKAEWDASVPEADRVAADDGDDGAIDHGVDGREEATIPDTTKKSTQGEWQLHNLGKPVGAVSVSCNAAPSSASKVQVGLQLVCDKQHVPTEGALRQGPQCGISLDIVLELPEAALQRQSNSLVWAIAKRLRFVFGAVVVLGVLLVIQRVQRLKA